MKKIAILSLLALAACGDPIQPGRANDMPLPSYVKDARVNICYSMIVSTNVYGNVVSHTEVDCEKVEPLLQSIRE